jgi:uncharacterized membrane protein YgcG
VARGVDDVDFDPLERDCRVFRQDRDPPLLLQVVGIHDPLFNHLIVAKHFGLAQHGVDERRLAVVDVRDDGDVAHVGAGRRVGQGGRRRGGGLGGGRVWGGGGVGGRWEKGK